MLLLLAAFASIPSTTFAEPPQPGAIERTWARTDQPVAAGAVSRTWMWGPQANTEPITETYAEAPGGQRIVQYFDKSRMEITDPAGDQSSPWFVTNGLLVRELITGEMQVGNTQFEHHDAAGVNIAGDADDTSGPTYAAMREVLSAPAYAQGATITTRIGRNGNTWDDPALAGHNVTAAELVDVPGIQHRVASPFWAFMNATGVVSIDGQLVNDRLFETPYYATGYPITEAYWASVKVAGTVQDVLLQCFERRCLTFTPANDPNWRVEMGNVGQHYSTWRAEVTEPIIRERESALVTRVVDGDTIDVEMNGQTFRVRLIGIDTPEVFGGVQCYGHEASEMTRQLLLGKQVGMIRDVSETDRYGRLLRYVWQGSLFVNDYLVRHGYAYASTYPPDVMYADQFAAAQAEARAANRGLWAGCPADPGQPTATATQLQPTATWTPSPTVDPNWTPPPTWTPRPQPTATATATVRVPPTATSRPSGCHPSYPTICLPYPPPDLNCSDIPYRRFTVLPPDPHRLDGDGNGIGCESG